MRTHVTWIALPLLLLSPAPAGALFAIDDSSGVVRLDPDTGAELQSYPLVPVGGESPSLAFDGALLYAFDAGPVRRFDAETGGEIASLQSIPAIDHLSHGASSFGPTLFTADFANEVTLRNPATGAAFTSYNLFTGGDPFFTLGADHSPADGTLFVATAELAGPFPGSLTAPTIREVDASTGALIRSFPLPVIPAALAFEGERLFLAEFDGPRLIEVEAATGLLLDAIPGHHPSEPQQVTALAGAPALSGPPALALESLAAGWEASVLATLDFETRVLAVDAAANLYVADTSETADGTVEILKLAPPAYDPAAAQVFFSYTAESGYCCVNGLAFAPGEQVAYTSVRSFDGESGIVDRVTFPGPVVTRHADLAESPSGDPFRATGIGVSGDGSVFLTARRGLEYDFGAVWAIAPPGTPALSRVGPTLVGRGVAADAAGNRFVAVKSGPGFATDGLYHLDPGGFPRQRIARFQGLQPDEIAVGADGTVYAALHRAGETLVVALNGPLSTVPATPAWSLGLLAATLAVAGALAAHRALVPTGLRSTPRRRRRGPSCPRSRRR